VISVEDNAAMIACTKYMENNVMCYYDRSQLIKYAECLRHQRSYNGTFALEEFRKVGEQKKTLQAKARVEKRRVVRLRRVMLKLQAEI
jgi:glycine/serine hydroxymethyltransferase